MPCACEMFEHVCVVYSMLCMCVYICVCVLCVYVYCVCMWVFMHTIVCVCLCTCVCVCVCVCVCFCVCPLFHTFSIHYNLLLIIYWGMLTIQHDYFNNIFSGMLTTVHTEMVCMSSI